MEVEAFDTSKLPSPWREVLETEVAKLKAMKDVIAIGVAGSWAQEDTWPHSDIDLEVVLRGEHEFSLKVTEPGEISVDFGIFGENILGRLPYETRPLYDPEGVMRKELSSRGRDEFLERMLKETMEQCRDYLERAEDSLTVDPRSTLTFLHLFTWDVSEFITVASGDNRTVKRRCSRLERAVKRHGREDLLDSCGKLYGFPETLKHSKELLRHLKAGYREIWSFFKGKESGPAYMIQQPDSELWFRNRIAPVYEADARDLVWIVYIEFPFVTSFLFRNLTDRERLPLDLFVEGTTFGGSPAKWITRHSRCLDLFDMSRAEEMLSMAQELVAEAEEFSSLGLYKR